jgi:hypothetical protein
VLARGGEMKAFTPNGIMNTEADKNPTGGQGPTVRPAGAGHASPVEPLPAPPTDDELDRAIDPEYAAISTRAVLGLLASLAGITGLLAMPLVLLSVLGFFLGLLGLRQIRRSEGVVVGRPIALAAALLGAAVTLSITSYNGYYWLRDRAIYDEVKVQANAVTDEILAGRYEKVFMMMPEDFRRQQASGPEEFRKTIAPLFENAGKIVNRRLLSLHVVPTADTGLAVPAEVHIELERRYVDLTLVFVRNADGQWVVFGVGGAETFESMARFPPPPAPPAPPTNPDEPAKMPPSHPKAP